MTAWPCLGFGLAWGLRAMGLFGQLRKPIFGADFKNLGVLFVRQWRAPERAIFRFFFFGHFGFFDGLSGMGRRLDLLTQTKMTSKPFVRQTFSSSARPLGARVGALALAVLCAIPSLGALADETLPLPLTGEAYRVAQQAYADYDAHRYAQAAAGAREAIRQRPDSVGLRLLLANALAQEGNRGEARKELSRAISDLGGRPALASRLREIESPQVATGRVRAGRRVFQARMTVEGTESDPKFKAAQLAYDDYSRKDYEAAVRDARAAIELSPQNAQLHDLLIDALAASSQDDEAYAAVNDAQRQFGDSPELQERKRDIGLRLAPPLSTQALAALERGDGAEASRLAQLAVDYAPSRMGFRFLLVDARLAQGDGAGALDAATAATQEDPQDPLAWTLRGYAQFALSSGGGAPVAGEVAAQVDSDFSRALSLRPKNPRDARVARAIISDVRLAQSQPREALAAVDNLPLARDDTDSMIALRRHRAALALAHGENDSQGSPSAANAAVASSDAGDKIRPVFDCRSDQYGAGCDLYAADPSFLFTRDARLAAQRGDKRAAADYARKAVEASPDDSARRVELIDALANAGDARGAKTQAREMVDAGMLDHMDDLQAAFIAQRAGDDKLAFERFQAADLAGKLPPASAGDAGYAAIHAHENKAAAAYLERAIDAGTTDAPGVPPMTPTALQDARSAHAEATRDWGVNASVSYRGSGAQSGLTNSSLPGASNNWQTGTEAYWRPFGSLGDRMFELYARGYANFGVKGDNPSGAQTLESAIGARVKPFASSNTVFAFERILPIGSSTRSDWLGRLSYSNGFGTELRQGPPSWWTGVMYGEVGHYIEHSSSYATVNGRLGRTYRLDSVSPRLTVFPHLVLGADYDSQINHSLPVGIGAGVAARYWFRGDAYDTPRSFVDMSLQYRVKLSGDDRAKGLFFTTVFSY